MDISIILKVAGIGLLISALNMVLDKADKKDWSTYTTIAGVILVLSLVYKEAYELFNAVKTMFQLY